MLNLTEMNQDLRF